MRTSGFRPSFRRRSPSILRTGTSPNPESAQHRNRGGLFISATAAAGVNANRPQPSARRMNDLRPPHGVRPPTLKDSIPSPSAAVFPRSVTAVDRKYRHTATSRNSEVCRRKCPENAESGSPTPVSLKGMTALPNIRSGAVTKGQRRPFCRERTPEAPMAAPRGKEAVKRRAFPVAGGKVAADRRKASWRSSKPVRAVGGQQRKGESVLYTDLTLKCAGFRAR